jgi:hypothetical protein
MYTVIIPIDSKSTIVSTLNTTVIILLKVTELCAILRIVVSLNPFSYATLLYLNQPKSVFYRYCSTVRAPAQSIYCTLPTPLYCRYIQATLPYYQKLLTPSFIGTIRQPCPPKIAYLPILEVHIQATLPYYQKLLTPYVVGTFRQSFPSTKNCLPPLL